MSSRISLLEPILPGHRDGRDRVRTHRVLRRTEARLGFHGFVPAHGATAIGGFTAEDTGHGRFSGRPRLVDRFTGKDARDQVLMCQPVGASRLPTELPCGSALRLDAIRAVAGPPASYDGLGDGVLA